MEVNDDSLFTSSDDEIDGLDNKLYELAMKAKKDLNQANKKKLSLLNQIKEIKKENNDLYILMENLLV